MKRRLENRPTQTARIVALLRERSPHWVPLPDILALRISQYAARIYQARHAWGLNIENRVETVNGKRHSWFRLVESATLASAAVSETNSFPQFGDLAPERYPD